GGVGLVAGRGGVDQGLDAEGRSQEAVPPQVDSPGAGRILAVAGPGDAEVAGPVHGHGGIALVVGGGDIDAELPRQSDTEGRVTPGVDAGAATVLSGARP